MQNNIHILKYFNNKLHISIFYFSSLFIKIDNNNENKIENLYDSQMSFNNYSPLTGLNYNTNNNCSNSKKNNNKEQINFLDALKKIHQDLHKIDLNIE